MKHRRTKNEGTIYFSNNHELWVAQITLPDGQRKTKYSKDQKVVREWLLAERKALQDGVIVHGDKTTLSVCYDDQ